MGKLKNFFSGLFGKKEASLQVKNDGQQPKQTNVISPKEDGSVDATKKDVQSVVAPKIEEEITPIIIETSTEKKEDFTIIKPIIKEEKPLSEEEKFYREMKEICKPSTKFRVKIVNTYFMWASLYYEGDEKSVIIPRTVEVDGQEYNVRFLYSVWSQEISLENIFIEAAELTIANQYFKNARNIYFSSDVKKCEVYISDKKIIPTHLERINLTGATQSVKEYLLSRNVGLIPYFKTMPSDENGLKRLDGYVVGAEKTVEVYDSKEDDVVNLQWVSAEYSCKKVIIRNNVKKIVFPENKYDFIGDFEVINNPKFLVENNILYSIGKQKELIYFNQSYKESVLCIDKTVAVVASVTPAVVNTIIVEGVCKFNGKSIDLSTVREIVLQDKGMSIKATWLADLRSGATVYANDESVKELKNKKQFILKSLNEYGCGEVVEDVVVMEETVKPDIKEETVVIEVVKEPKAAEKVLTEEAAPVVEEIKEVIVVESAHKEVDEEQLKIKYSEEGYKRLEVIYKKLLNFYPEKKIFAFDSLCDTIRDSLSSIAKKCGISTYKEILADFGFEFIEKEETELLRNKVIYTPGNEPDFMMTKISNMLKVLAEYYPNKIIENSIVKEHKKLASNITGLYQWFGYPNTNEFLAAYGYDYKIAPPVNVVTFDTNELIEELQRRTEGKRLTSVGELKENNPDLAEKIEIVRTRSVKLYGATFVDYLQSKGIIYSVAQVEILALEDFLSDMREKYPQGSSFATVNALFAEKSNAHYDRAVLSSAVRSKYNLSLQEYLVQEKILVDKKADDAVKFADFELNSTKARIMSYHGTSTIVEIPAEIKIIEKGAFKNTAVEEISFKSGSLLTTIEEGAFEGCKNLKSIDFTNVTKSVKIKSGAFKNCEEFREIYTWQKIVKVYEGAFEGAKNIFIYDGEYIYPRLWLYNLSNNGCSGSTVFGIDETYGDDCTPLVEILTPYGRIDEYYVQINEIPIASRCGYNGIVYSGLYDFDNEDACYSNCKREFYMEFDLPTVESVNVYLKNYEIEIDESEKLDILKSEDKYVKKQRAIFENLKAYAAKRKAERKEKGLPEELLLENFPLITKLGEKQVYVKFIGGREYNYNCRFDVKKGDLVFVDGSMEGVLGYVDSVENGLASGDFMKDVVKAYAVKKSKSIFPYAIEEEEVFEVFPNLQVEERDEEDYGDYEDEEYEEDEDYDEYDDEDEDDGVSPQEDSVCEITNGKSSSGQDLFGRYELLDAKKLEHNLDEGSYEISLYIENCKTINGELKTSWVEGDERYDLFLVYYNDKEIGSIAVSARGNYEGSIKIEAAKVEIDGKGLKLNAVIKVDVVSVPSTPRYREDGKKVLVYSSHSVEGANILAYKNVDLTDSELDSLAKVLGKWVKTKTRKKATDDELKIMFLAVYDDFHVGDLIDEESSKEQFEKELKQYKTGKLDKENCSKMMKCYLRAIDLTKRGYEVFVGPFTENDELVLDHKNYVGIVLAEGANYGSPIEFNYENSEEILNETDDEEIEDEIEEQISYFAHEGFSSSRDQTLWNKYTDEVFFLKKEYHNPYCIALDSSTNTYSVAFISKKEARTKERFRISYKENRDTECSQYGMDYTNNFAYYAIYCDGNEVAEIPFDAENFTLVKNKDVKIIATYCSDGIISNYKEFEIHLLFQIDFKDANGKKIEFPEFGKTKQSRCKVKVKFPDGRSYFYNCEYAVQVGDKVQVGGKRSDQEGEIVAIENAWDSSPYMQCVEKVLSASGEVNPTQTKANRINIVQGVLEKPLIIDDDYPFGYERDDKMIKLINSARQGNQEAIKELVEIYSASNDAFVKEQKAEYWKRKLNKGDKIIVEGKTVNMIIKESVDNSIYSENFSVYLSVEDKNGAVVVLAESGRSKDDEFDENDCRLCYYGARRSSEDGYEWLTNYLPSEDEYIRQFIMDISIKDTAEILVDLIKGKTLPTKTASIGKAIKKYLKRKGVLIENICKYTIGCHEYPYFDNGYYPEAQWIKASADSDFESLAKEYNTDVNSLKTYLRFVQDKDLGVTLVRTETHDLQSGEVINTVKMYDYENDFCSGERAMWEWDFMSEEEDDGFYAWETSEEE